MEYRNFFENLKFINIVIFFCEDRLDKNEVLSFGGRIKRSNLNTEYIHQILLSGEGIVTNVLVKWYHQSVGRGRRGYTLNKIMSSGYWIVQTNLVVRSFIDRCVRCRYLRGKVGEQKMADLLADRISTEPPFTVELDMFGPFTVKHHRKEMKRYGIMFTGLSSRVVHLEVVQNMETDSFSQALRKFIACRGNIRLIRCDNGTNFVDAKSELQRSFSEMDEDNITSPAEWWN